MIAAKRLEFIAMVLSLLLAGCGGSGYSTPTGGADASSSESGSDATLTTLDATAIKFDQIFQPSTLDYTATTSFLIDETAIAVTANDDGASISIDGTSINSGEMSGPVSLSEGFNKITIDVVAEDGIHSESYTLDIERNEATQLEPSFYVKASNPGSGDRFGATVAAWGDLLAIGAAEEDSGAIGVNGDGLIDTSPDSGAVYVFARDSAGTWVQEAYLKSSNSEAGDQFGRSVALFGDTLAIGAVREDGASEGINGDETDNDSLDSGAVYVFRRGTGGVWMQEGYIKPSNPDSRDGFGVALALSANTLVVGADHEDSAATGVDGDQTDNGGDSSGAVYVFSRASTGDWVQQAYLKASNSDAGDLFGSAVSLSGDTLAVGAYNEASKTTGIDGSQSSNSWPGAGAVYIFVGDSDGGWTQQAYLKASNTGNGDLFGYSVRVSGNTLVVGAPWEDSSARGIGGIQTDNKALNSGAVYVFERDSNENWNQQAYIKASNADAQDLFGSALALKGGLLAVGAMEDSMAVRAGGDEADNSFTNSGAVYLFTRDGTGDWIQSAYLKASNTNSFDEFGAAVAIGADYLAAGAPAEDGSGSGVGGNQIANDAPDSGAVYIVQ